LNSEVTIMKHQPEKTFDVENVGWFDSALRGSLATALILGVLLIPSVSSTTLVVMTLIAVYAGFTAFIGWDPVYAMMKGPRRVSQQQTSQPVAAAPQVDKRSEPAHEDVQKKAA